jgi:hypothetical protein
MPSTRLWFPFQSRLGECSYSRPAWQALESLHQQQASAFAYFDVFLMLTVVTLGLVPVLLLVKRSVARKARIAGERAAGVRRYRKAFFVSGVLRVQ